MRSPDLTTKAKAQIIGMNQVGVRRVEIALELGMPATTVYTVFQNLKTWNTVFSPQQIRQPSRLSDRNKRSLRRLMNQDRRLPLAEIISNLPEKVAVGTARKTLHGLGYHSHLAAKKPFINEKQRIMRLAFVKWYKDWTVDD
jgi:hypothetical protein